MKINFRRAKSKISLQNFAGMPSPPLCQIPCQSVQKWWNWKLSRYLHCARWKQCNRDPLWAEIKSKQNSKIRGTIYNCCNLCWRSGDLLLVASAATTLGPSAEDAWWSANSPPAVGGVRPSAAGQPYGACPRKPNTFNSTLKEYEYAVPQYCKYGSMCFYFGHVQFIMHLFL